MKDCSKLITGTALAAALILTLLISAPAGAKKTDAGDCKPDGKPCICNTGNGCGHSCDGSGCKFEQHGGGGATFKCAKGKCTVFSDGGGATNLYCAGGGCTMTCTGAGACSVHQCKDCKLECSGGGHCDRDGKGDD
jgi:hypothetical protein